MRKILLAAGLALGLTACDSADTISEPVTAITGVTVLDASQQTTNATVLISGNIIQAVGPDLDVPEDATVIDGAGKFLIPGLWDAHVHLSYYPDLGVETSYPLYIANGITSVRDTGGLTGIVLPMRDAAQVDGAIAPRVHVAGPLVDGTQRVYAGLNGRPNISVGVSTPDEARAEIDRLHEAGVDLIKLYEMNTPETFAAAAARANALNLPITAHVPLSMDAVAAAEAGVDGMEHLRNLEMSCAANYRALLAERTQVLADGVNEDGGTLRSSLHRLQRSAAIAAQDTDRCNEVIAALAREEVFQTPTLTVNTIATERLFNRVRWKETFAYLPPIVQEQWAAGSARMAEVMRPSTDSAAFAAWSFAMVAKLRDGGVKVMAGTDTPIGFLTPGFALHEELAFLVQGGLTPMEALTGATLYPAQFMRMDDRMGTVEAGKLADLVLLDADPREDIRNTQSINTVIKDGRVFDRAALDGMLTDLEVEGYRRASKSASATPERTGGVLVFGGTGQLGSEVVKDLVAAGEKVTVLARPTSNRDRLEGLDVTYAVGDMLNADDMERVFASAAFRVVVDASGLPGRGDQNFYFKSQEIISALALKTGVEQIILHGAIGAGDSAEMFMMENMPGFQAVSIAAKSKAEGVLTSSGVPYTIIRHMTLLPLESTESGSAILTEDHTTVGAMTRDGLARLTMECLGADKCMDKIFHAVDLEVELTGRYTGMWERYKMVLKPGSYKLPD
ncbi:MAG: amidohydrolase family protein [Rhodospirillaceae bacterium]|nr:amidohydrolase family protein [Rhodospirillaceae bacterium]MBT5564436.1 amidohydrolase family protein [Rhodospirillaceae bacterium]MBT6089727.1 amidohydrolase family protein [Rhodospirillaceae bacterium]